MQLQVAIGSHVACSNVYTQTTPTHTHATQLKIHQHRKGNTFPTDHLDGWIDRWMNASVLCLGPLQLNAGRTDRPDGHGGRGRRIHLRGESTDHALDETPHGNRSARQNHTVRTFIRITSTARIYR
jgi:hypothetical protein